MKIVIAGGKSKADFLIGSLLQKNHKLVVINDDFNYCEYLASTHELPVVYGTAYKQEVLDDANIQNFDILISLLYSDSDNLAVCQIAKHVYNIKKTVCIVSNPVNVEIFKKLGVNIVISATYLVSNMIEQASTIENLIATLSLENNKIILTELVVDKTYPVCNKKLLDIKFPSGIIISCILRNDAMIVPNGTTIIYPNDKLLIISSPENQEKVIALVSGGFK